MPLQPGPAFLFADTNEKIATAVTPQEDNAAACSSLRVYVFVTAIWFVKLQQGAIALQIFHAC